MTLERIGTLLGLLTAAGGLATALVQYDTAADTAEREMICIQAFVEYVGAHSRDGSGD